MCWGWSVIDSGSVHVSYLVVSNVILQTVSSDCSDLNQTSVNSQSFIVLSISEQSPDHWHIITTPSDVSVVDLWPLCFLQLVQILPTEENFLLFFRQQLSSCSHFIQVCSHTYDHLTSRLTGSLINHPQFKIFTVICTSITMKAILRLSPTVLKRRKKENHTSKRIT